MTPEIEQAAKLAKELLENKTLMQALNDVRFDASEALLTVNAEDIAAIRDLQATGRACELLVGKLNEAILAATVSQLHAVA